MGGNTFAVLRVPVEYFVVEGGAQEMFSVVWKLDVSDSLGVAHVWTGASLGSDDVEQMNFALGSA
jgi:hypothetical protein